MKKSLLFLTMVWFSFSALAQTPQAFKYQTVARNNAGEILASQNISFQMTLLQGALPGNAVYTETHSATTNATGLATLEIGRGTPVTGSFATINWSTTPVFLKTEIDPAGGSAFVEMGTSELLSVPYALFAENTANNDDADANPANELQTLTQNSYQVSLSQNGGSFLTGILSYSQTEIDALIPYNGLTVHNTTTNCINYYYVNNWFEACGTCTPQPSQANAGADQSFTNSTTTVTLDATSPTHGTGLWTIVSGDGGTIENAINPTSGFTGQACQSYNLMWSVTTSCGSSTDNVNIAFNYQPTAPDAGPDQIGIGGSTTTLAANTPADGTGLWAVVSGEGGSFGDPTSPVSTFTGVPTTDYTLSWTISTPCASLNDEVNIRFWSCGLPIADARDSKTYTTIQIGTQCWMAQNLNVGTRIAGTANMANNTTIEKYCCSNSDAQCDVYGGLYQWDEMMNYSTTPGVQGICPDGWHLPTDAEWCTLTTYLDATVNCSTIGWSGTNAGGKMKETGTTHWSSPNTGATNSSAFTGLPGGYRDLDGTFNALGIGGYWWSSTEYSATIAWIRHLLNYNANLYRYNYTKGFGFSVRCLKD